ncbi:N-acetylglucosamine-6-phosphate deacetylase [Hansschlegelia quercus]|uniref:N-acetylglucosamine-6-phosphate deacetylase n=1 Tax=Hansschlegelia quercus TaxID=2528245 RepID=A0A4V2JDX6_9HYPH|nr:N-acetylglucosamine-6-phosphate deacetylase [Hansschlegelia quercus]TBN52439.1 N-acetylglucosamine-6-phosphate deacetylase [Hansschlegelia quercus]
MSRFVLKPQRLFDGQAFRDGAVVLVDGQRIAAVGADADMPSEVARIVVEGLLAPGFIDVQVNGGGGVLLNDDPSPAAMAAIARAHRRFGTTGLLPTLITDTSERMAAALAASDQAVRASVPGVLGVHIEGPFLNPARKGVHDPALMRAPKDDDLALLTEARAGATLVTLAPEMVGQGAVARLASAGAKVAAGHTEADAATLDEARRAGMTGYTHLFNAMPPMGGRAPGPVGAALSERVTFCGLIVDMHHVSAEAMKASIAAKGFSRVMLVTDSMSTIGTDVDEFVLQGRRILRGGGRLMTEDGTLAGSDLDMASAVRNVVEALGLPLGQALAMASIVPAAFLGLNDHLGCIAPGLRADLVALNDALEVSGTWIAGSYEAA